MYGKIKGRDRNFSLTLLNFSVITIFCTDLWVDTFDSALFLIFAYAPGKSAPWMEAFERVVHFQDLPRRYPSPVAIR